MLWSLVCVFIFAFSSINKRPGYQQIFFLTLLIWLIVYLLASVFAIIKLVAPSTLKDSNDLT